MKTKILTSQKPKRKVVVRKEHTYRNQGHIITAKRNYIGESISFYLDILFDPRHQEELFRAIESKNTRSYSLHAASDDLTIHFTMEWKQKGGE